MRVFFKAERCKRFLRGKGYDEEVIAVASSWINKLAGKEATFNPTSKQYEIDGYVIHPEWLETGGSQNE